MTLIPEKYRKDYVGKKRLVLREYMGESASVVDTMSKLKLFAAAHGFDPFDPLYRMEGNHACLYRYWTEEEALGDIKRREELSDNRNKAIMCQIELEKGLSPWEKYKVRRKFLKNLQNMS